jgi:flagellar biosynthetic protein FliR
MFTNDLATCFVAALEMAAPIIAVLFAVQVGLALLAKAAPQMNVWMLGMPVQILLVLGLAVTGIATIPGYLSALVTRIVQDMGALLGGV